MGTYCRGLMSDLTRKSVEPIALASGADAVVSNEIEPDVVQISGGEPTIHPQFFEVLDAATS